MEFRPSLLSIQRKRLVYPLAEASIESVKRDQRQILTLLVVNFLFLPSVGAQSAYRAYCVVVILLISLERRLKGRLSRVGKIGFGDLDIEELLLSPKPMALDVWNDWGEQTATGLFYFSQIHPFFDLLWAGLQHTFISQSLPRLSRRPPVFERERRSFVLMSSFP